MLVAPPRSPLTRRVLLTGASGGIGLATASALAAAGVAVHAVVRSDRAAAAVRHAVSAAAPHAEVECHVADLAELSQVRALVDTLCARAVPLDGLVLNAAAPPPAHRELTADGFERQFAVGHLAHFALTVGLWPRLTHAVGGRIVVVASQVAYGATLDLDAVDALLARGSSRTDTPDITGDRYHPVRTYGAVKLANVLFTVGLAARLRAAGGTAVCLHPGIVRTALLDALLADQRPRPSVLARAVAPVRTVVGRALRPLRARSEAPRWWDTPDEAAARIAAALLDPTLRSGSGVFLQDGAVRPLHDLAHEAEAVERLWHASERLLESR
jgi:NAD(P)-dependent dehydrogenase (short-subunit alcohol dehydrogenase family)